MGLLWGVGAYTGDQARLCAKNAGGELMHEGGGGVSETDHQICQVKPVSVSKWDCVWFCDSNILPPCPHSYILAW